MICFAMNLFQSIKSFSLHSCKSRTSFTSSASLPTSNIHSLNVFRKSRDDDGGDEEPSALIQDQTALQGDVALMLNNVLSIDLWVTSKRASSGFTDQILYFIDHLPSSVNHAGVLCLCWILSSIFTGAYKNPTEIPSEEAALGLAFRTWAFHLPLYALAYVFAANGWTGGILESGPQFTVPSFGLDVGFTLTFLVIWRMSYWRWCNGMF